MQRFVVFAALIGLICHIPAAAGDDVIYDAVWQSVDLESPLPADLTAPDGKTRWELGEASVSKGWARTIREQADGMLSVRETRTGFTSPVLYGAAAREWWMPHQAATGQPLRFTEIGEQTADELWIQTKSLGSGWVFLPSGPREARLERSLVMRSLAGVGSFVPDRLVYRWIDPRAGAVAEVWGVANSNGTAISRIEGAATVESVIRGGVGLRIFQDELETSAFQRVQLGFDRRGECTFDGAPCVENADCTSAASDKCTIPVSDVTTVAHATIGDLINASSWDFTPTQLADARYEIGTATVPSDSTETCSWDECGFVTTTNMGREDKNFNNFAPDRQDLFITLSATEGEQRVNDYTIWLRAGIRHEGITTGALGETESRFCYDGNDPGGDPRPEVPLWRFGTEDVGGEWYMENGDSWTHPPFDCEQSVFSHVCPADCDGLTCVYIAPCSGSPATNPGTQSGDVIGEGPVTLPSGHVMNALLVRNVVAFCAYPFSGCSFLPQPVHQIIYLWVVPNVGTVVRLMSEQEEVSTTTFDDLSETDIKYGLFPPISISSTNETDTTIDISWDPGTITHHISGYKVYWDTDSGSSSSYSFDSVNNAGQVSIVGTTATISGLTAGNDYYITVTAMSDYYTDPFSGVTTTYESLLFPTAAPGAGGPLPPELVATTTGGACTPTEVITGVTMDKAGPGAVEICWTASADTCVTTYEILHANSPESAANFSTEVADTGGATCHTFSPPDGSFIILGKGTGGTGPWGHFGM